MWSMVAKSKLFENKKLIDIALILKSWYNWKAIFSEVLLSKGTVIAYQNNTLAWLLFNNSAYTFCCIKEQIGSWKFRLSSHLRNWGFLFHFFFFKTNCQKNKNKKNSFHAGSQLIYMLFISNKKTQTLDDYIYCSMVAFPLILIYSLTIAMKFNVNVDFFKFKTIWKYDW